MRHRELSRGELHERAMRALAKELGPVGFIRFLNDLQPGRGDYTKDRSRWLSHVEFRAVSRRIRASGRRRRTG
jgi:hypothetical protein